MVSEYLLRTIDLNEIPCGVGYGALKRGVDQILYSGGNPRAAIVERSDFQPGATDPFCTTIVAVVSHKPLLDLGERGHVLVTREATVAERVAIDHYSAKLSFLDLSQSVVSYACRYLDTEETSEYKRGLVGLEDAVRCAKLAGIATIMRHIEGIEGYQPVAILGRTGYFYTKSADETERTFLKSVRMALEFYGEFPPILPLDGEEARTVIMEALQAVTVDDPTAQKIAFCNLLKSVTTHGINLFWAAASGAIMVAA